VHAVRVLSVKHFTFRLIYTARGWACISGVWIFKFRVRGIPRLQVLDPRTVRVRKQQQLMSIKWLVCSVFTVHLQYKVSDNDECSSQCTLDPSIMLLTASCYTGGRYLAAPRPGQQVRRPSASAEKTADPSPRSTAVRTTLAYT